jgi:hypothetical protein
VAGPNAGRRVAYDPEALAKKHGFGKADALTFHHRLLFGTDPTPEAKKRLASLPAARMVTALLSSPEAQLG